MNKPTMTYREIMRILSKHMQSITECIKTTEDNLDAKDYIAKLKIERLEVAGIMLLFKHRFSQKFIKEVKMTTKKKVLKKKAAPKKQAGGKQLTSREKISKYCQVVKKPQQLGCVLVYGKHQYRMNKTLDELSDVDCDRVLGKLNSLWGIEKKAAAGKPIPAKRRIVVSVESKACECGCKVLTRKGSRFLPGHDMKLKSKLRKALKVGNANAKAHAKKELKARGW